MSLINQMLRDLDRRHHPGAIDRILHDLLPANALADERPLARVLPWVLLALALAALALLWLDLRTHRDPGAQGIELAVPQLLTSSPARSVEPGAVTPASPAPAVPAAAMPAAEIAAPEPAVVPAPAPVAAPAPVMHANPAPPAPASVVRAASVATSAAPPAASDAHEAEHAALLAAERNWRPDEAAPSSSPTSRPPASDAPDGAEEWPGAMRIQPSPGPRATDITAVIRQAENQIAHGEVERGLGRLHDAVLAAPDREAVRLAYVRELLRAGRKEVAEAELRAGIAAAPRAARLAQTLGHLLFDRGDSAGALAVLLGAAPPVAEAPDYHAFIAALEQRAGDHAAAISRYRAIVAATPGHGAAWIGLGISLAAVDERAAASGAFAQARATASLSPTMDAYAAAEISRLQAGP